jgi:hypothetical protein
VRESEAESVSLLRVCRACIAMEEAVAIAWRARVLACSPSVRSRHSDLVVAILAFWVPGYMGMPCHAAERSIGSWPSWVQWYSCTVVQWYSFTVVDKWKGVGGMQVPCKINAELRPHHVAQ